jgi:hypothetical protein
MKASGPPPLPLKVRSSAPRPPCALPLALPFARWVVVLLVLASSGRRLAIEGNCQRLNVAYVCAPSRSVTSLSCDEARNWSDGLGLPSVHGARTSKGAIRAKQCRAVQCTAIWCNLMWWRVVQCSAVQCSALHCNAKQLSAVECGRVRRMQYCVAGCGAVKCSAVQSSAVQCSAVQYKAMQVQRNKVQCGRESAVQCGAVRCGAVQHNEHHCNAMICCRLQCNCSDV